MNTGFHEVGIGNALVQGLAKQGITVPTEVQKKAIPEILMGKDVIAHSQTGSGKTLAYLLPLVEKLDMELRSVQVLILTPTHELAAQVVKQVELLAKNAEIPLRCALIIGSASMTRQVEKLKEKPQIVVGSAGRIMDLIQKRKLPAHTVKSIVLDEGDRLLDEKNFDAVQAVIKTTLRDRQLLAFSASISEQTRKKAESLMKENKIDFTVEEEGLLPTGISHYYIQAGIREKFLVLRKILAGEKPTKAIVFLNNPENIEVTVDKLNFHGIQSAGLYGAAYKTQRRNAMEDFRSGRVSVLVASDIGARGIDILDVTHIINLDIPEEPTFYLHRAGRTGRKGQKGIAISIVTPYERKWIHKYQKVWNLCFTEKVMSFGKLVDVDNKTKKTEKINSKEKTNACFKEKTGIKHSAPRQNQNEKKGEMKKGQKNVKK